MCRSQALKIRVKHNSLSAYFQALGSTVFFKGSLLTFCFIFDKRTYAWFNIDGRLLNFSVELKSKCFWIPKSRFIKLLYTCYFTLALMAMEIDTASHCMVLLRKIILLHDRLLPWLKPFYESYNYHISNFSILKVSLVIN